MHLEQPDGDGSFLGAHEASQLTDTSESVCLDPRGRKPVR